MITFGRLSDLFENAKALNVNSGLFFVFSKEETQEFILYLNRISQLFEQGVDIEGNIMGVYAFSTEILNTRESFTYKGATGTKRKTALEPYFLLDTAELYDSFTVQVDRDSFTVQAMTIKEDGDDLIEKFGQFVGLTEESQNQLIKKIAPSLCDWVLDVLLGDAR